MPENHAAALAALGDRETEVSELAVAQWCVAELKGVHSGRANAHVHTALDALLASLTTGS